MEYLVDVAALGLPRSSLEIGCGSGSFSIALAQRTNSNILAVDVNADVVELAIRATAEQHLLGSVSFRVVDAKELAHDTYDLVVCVGSSHAFGSPKESLHSVRKLLKSGGTLIYADLVWASKPHSEYLEILGCSEDLYWPQDHGEKEFAAADLRVKEQIVAAAQSWREFEEGVLATRITRAKLLPMEDGIELLGRAENWFRAYERYGKDCLGFVAYIATISD